MKLLKYMLYEFLENYSLSIPQYGTVTCRPDQRPIVIITSNGYRELYLYFKRGYQLMPNYAEETLALLAGSYFDQPDVSLWNYQLLLKPLMVKSPVEAQHFQEALRNYLQLKNSLRDK